MTTGTVTGTFTDRTAGVDTAGIGSVTFTPSVPRLLDSAGNEIVLPDRVVCTLDAAGHFSTVLQATDDVSLNPAAWTWQALVDVGTGRPWSFSFTVPCGSTQDLADIAPVPSSAGDAVIPVGVQAVVAGTGVAVDATDPQRPIVSATGAGAGVASVTAGDNVVVSGTTSDPVVGVPSIPAADVTGLGSAATHAATDFATAAQGTTADSAVQPGDLATVATTGAYSNLSGRPTLGTAAAHADTDFLSGIAADSLGGDLSAANFKITAAKTVTFNGEIDNGNSGTAKTVDFTAGQKHKLTLTGNCTLTLTPPAGAANVLLRLVQDATGGRTVTWPSMKWAGGTAPTLTATAAGVDIVALYYDGAAWWGQASTGFA